MTITLSAPLDDELAAYAQKEAGRAGLDLGEYLGRLIAADRAAAAGTPEEQRARADRMAAVAYQDWVAAGRPQEDAVSMDEVFG
jgi:hypothetical protein